MITGCNESCGKICDALSNYGANLILVDNVSKDKISNQAGQIVKKYKSQVIPIQLNVQMKKNKKALNKFNKIDVFVNLAAIDLK